MTKLEGLQLFYNYSYNVLPFWLISSRSDIPYLPRDSLVNIRSQKSGDRAVSYVNLKFSAEKVSELLDKHGSFILQCSYPRSLNETTNVLRIVDGEITHLETVVASQNVPVVETRDIADGRSAYTITLPRWRAERCVHLIPHMGDLHDLAILLPIGTYLIEFNTTNRSVGPLKKRIVYWEVLKEG